jgi:hypothetical protein
MSDQHRQRLRRRVASKQPSSSFALTIDELTLTGFDPSDRHRIGDAAQAELSRLFERERPGQLTTGARLDRVDAGNFTIAAGARAETTGVNLAGAIHRSVIGQTSGSSSRRGVVARQNNDDRPPPIERTMEVQPARFFSDAYAVPECDAGQVYDAGWRRCRPPICSDFSIDQARQYVIRKLSETGKYVPRLAAAIRRGRFARFFPTALEEELTKGAMTVVSKLKAGTITFVCPAMVSGAETDGTAINLPLFAAAGSPPWSQTLLGNVSLHEGLHLICSNLPSRPGTDPYGNAAKVGGDPASAMHPDLVPIMTAFPLHLPKW